MNNFISFFFEFDEVKFIMKTLSQKFPFVLKDYPFLNFTYSNCCLSVNLQKTNSDKLATIKYRRHNLRIDKIYCILIYYVCKKIKNIYIMDYLKLSSISRIYWKFTGSGSAAVIMDSVKVLLYRVLTYSIYLQTFSFVFCEYEIYLTRNLPGKNTACDISVLYRWELMVILLNISKIYCFKASICSILFSF